MKEIIRFTQEDYDKFIKKYSHAHDILQNVIKNENGSIEADISRISFNNKHKLKKDVLKYFRKIVAYQNKNQKNSKVYWILFFLSIILFFISSNFPIPLKGELIIGTYFFSFIFSLLLEVRYWKQLCTWFIWNIVVIVLTILSLMINDTIQIHNYFFSQFVALFFIIVLFLFIFTTLSLLFYKDAGLKLFFFTSILGIWMSYFAWKIYGNLIELSLKSISITPDYSFVKYLGFTMMLIGIVMPLSLLSFLGHTIKIVIDEITPNTKRITSKFLKQD